jgi:hypothetical protein
MPRRSNLPSLALAVVILVALAAGAGALVWWKMQEDSAAKAVAAVQAKARFVAVKAAMERRLNQPHPIQLGAVWVTHTGRICGLVYGEGSFSGMTGMTPFYTDGGKVRFALDETPNKFDPGWVGCGEDMWVQIVPGSTEEGICGVPKFASRCHPSDRRPPPS